MGALRKSLWTIVAIAALPASAAATDVCPALQRIISASRESTPFDSVRRALAGGEVVVPGFLPEECSVTAGAVSCDHRSMALTQFDDWPDPLPCSGFVALPTDRRAPRRDWVRGYLAGGLRIEMATWCAMCAGPGATHFNARFYRPARGH